MPIVTFGEGNGKRLARNPHRRPGHTIGPRSTRCLTNDALLKDQVVHRRNECHHAIRIWKNTCTLPAGCSNAFCR
ncbi:MAG: hypothetical protein CMM05_06730 [Rhodopirellula sp.]|nr:hypothetical protein [Rhodopirellula sp.]